MVEAVNAFIGSAMASPWALLAIFLVCAIDAFFPVVPSETTVIAAGTVAAAGDQSLLWAVMLAASGAFAGDHVSYAIGRQLGVRAVRRVLRGQKGRAVQQWAEKALRTRGGLMIVALRFVPGGRTATTVTAGTLHYPLWRFSAFAGLAAALWAMYGGFIGYFAGETFQGNHLLAVTVGIGVSAAISVVTEIVRVLVRRGRDRAVSSTAPARPATVSVASSPAPHPGKRRSDGS